MLMLLKIVEWIVSININNNKKGEVDKRVM